MEPTKGASWIAVLVTVLFTVTVFLKVLVLTAVLVTIEVTVLRPTQHRLSYAAHGFQGVTVIPAGHTGHKFRLSRAGKRTRSASSASAWEAGLSSVSGPMLSNRRCVLRPAAVTLSATRLCSVSVAIDVTLTVSVVDTVRERVRVRLFTMAPCLRAQQQDVEPVPGVLIDQIRSDQIRVRRSLGCGRPAFAHQKGATTTTAPGPVRGCPSADTPATRAHKSP